jgi:hypothetical protein
MFIHMSPTEFLMSSTSSHFTPDIHGSMRSSEKVVPQQRPVEKGSLHSPNPGSTLGANDILV